MKSSEQIEDMVAEYRKIVPFVENDTVMYPYINASVEFIKTQKI